MRFLNKYFFIGLATGVLLTIAVLVVGGLIFVKTMSEIMHEDAEEVVAMLPAPKFPDHSNLSVYGQADYDWSIRALDGKELRLSDFKGKVVFLNL